LHDHPWSFVSVILRGGYTEDRLDKHEMRVRQRHRRFVNVMRRDDAHSIVELDGDRPVWSLLFVGRRRRTWGYWRPVPDSTLRSRLWTPFDRDVHADEFDAALARRSKRHDPTYGRIDFDIQDAVDAMQPRSLEQRVAMEDTLQAKHCTGDAACPSGVHAHGCFAERRTWENGQ
jgi:hypothetical protein